MRDAENEVTQADREAAAKASHEWAMCALSGAGNCSGLKAQAFARHRLASIEAACREKDAEIAKWMQANIQMMASYDDLMRHYDSMTHERDRLRAKLDEARKVFEEIAIAKGDHPNNSDYTRGWNDARHRLREIARAFLASAPQPEQKAQGDGVEPVGHAGSMPGTAGFTMAAFRAEEDRPDAD